MKRPIGVVDIVFSCTTGAMLLGVGWTRLVVKSFAKMFDDFGGSLPTITRLELAEWPSALVMIAMWALLSIGLWIRRPVLLVVATSIGAIAIAAFFWGMYAPIWELAGNVRAD